MISQADFIAMCGLEPREIAAIAEHEHLPEIQAAALASCLLRDPDGVKVIRQIIADDITNAIECNRFTHANELFHTLRDFIERHPEAADDLILG
jgi:hypothetical protein